VRFEVSCGRKTRIISGDPRRRTAAVSSGRRQIGRLELRATISCCHSDLQAAAASPITDWINVIISSKTEMKFLAALEPRSWRCGMWAL